MKNIFFKISVLTVFFFISSNAHALTCIKAVSKIKNGKVTTTLSSVERAKCKKGEILSPEATVGIKGEQGPQGPKGDPGPVLVRHTHNAEVLSFPLQSSGTVVAIIGSNHTYPGTYSDVLVQPADVNYLAVNVQAHVYSIVGPDVICALERKVDSSTWGALAEITVPPTDSEAFMNASFANLTPGSSISVRVRCRCELPGCSAKGEIGLVAGAIN